MMTLDDEQAAARAWFESLRDRICAEFLAIEREAGSDAGFEYLTWNREDDSEAKGGGGVRGVMTGKVFEKVGVNVSTVGGALSGDFAKTVPARKTTPFPPPASAWSRIWPTRMCRLCI
jgi:coproporphyrinogen III oxidase